MTELICIICPRGCHLRVDEANGCAVEGHGCKRGVEYGQKELMNPTRGITSTVTLTGGALERLPVKTSAPIPKRLVMEAVRLLDTLEARSPVYIGDVIVPDILGTGVKFIATRNA